MKGIKMKYLVTFAYSKKTNVITGFDSDYYSDYENPIETDINEINIHSIICKIDENNKLSDKIKEIKDAFFNNQRNYPDFDNFQCIGITPIINDEIEQAIKNSFGNYEVKDEIKMDSYFNEIINQLFSVNEQTIQILIPQLNNLISLTASHIGLNHSYDELKEYLESKISNIDEKFQEVYKNLISILLDKIYTYLYVYCEMPNKEYMSYSRIERNCLMKNYSFIWK